MVFPQSHKMYSVTVFIINTAVINSPLYHKVTVNKKLIGDTALMQLECVKLI